MRDDILISSIGDNSDDIDEDRRRFVMLTPEESVGSFPDPLRAICAASVSPALALSRCRRNQVARI